jgi:hypothetical protein
VALVFPELVLVLLPCLGCVVFVRAARSARRGAWNSAAASARIATLLEGTVAFLYLVGLYRIIFDQDFAALVLPPVAGSTYWLAGIFRTWAVAVGALVAVALAVSSAILWLIAQRRLGAPV